MMSTTRCAAVRAAMSFSKVVIAITSPRGESRQPTVEAYFIILPLVCKAAFFLLARRRVSDKIWQSR